MSKKFFYGLTGSIRPLLLAMVWVTASFTLSYEVSASRCTCCGRDEPKGQQASCRNINPRVDYTNFHGDANSCQVTCNKVGGYTGGGGPSYSFSQ
jgi:hypothetical protein